MSATTYQQPSVRMFRRSSSGTLCEHVHVSLAGESYCCAEGGAPGRTRRAQSDHRIWPIPVVLVLEKFITEASIPSLRCWTGCRRGRGVQGRCIRIPRGLPDLRAVIISRHGGAARRAFTRAVAGSTPSHSRRRPRAASGAERAGAPPGGDPRHRRRAEHLRWVETGSVQSVSEGLEAYGVLPLPHIDL